MRHILRAFAVAATFGLGSVSTAQAASVTPDFDTFGPLTTLSGGTPTFGGSGIPTDPAVIRDVDFGGGTTVRLGLIATPRFGSPVLTNDGAGTYFSAPGESDPGLGLWNVSFYLEANNGASLTSGLTATLFYDLDPAAGTDSGDLGSLALSAAAFLGTGSLTLPVIEGSQNIGFGFFNTASPLVVLPAGMPTYDPFAQGEYSFILEVTDGSTTGQVALNVNAVPLPPAVLMLGVGVAGLSLVGRRRRRAA